MIATRRLAAILAANVARYSRLMGADEESTSHISKGCGEGRFSALNYRSRALARNC
jgi:hypothetical protein